MRLNKLTREILTVIPAVGVIVLGTGLPTDLEAAGTAEVTQSISRADLDRLGDRVEALRDDVERRPSDQQTRQLRSDLDLIDDDLAFLRVTLRRGDAVNRRDYNEIRARITDLEGQLEDAARADGLVVPVGTELDVRLQDSLSSDTAQVEDRFTATTASDLRIGGELAVPAGAVVRGLVNAVDRSSRTDRSASLTLAFDQMTVDGRTYPVRLTVTEALESGIRDEANRIGVGAGVGGIIGGLLGGVRGALTGILIGAGGTIAATEGEDVDLDAGTLLRVRFDSPLTLRTE